ncbi:MAG: FAD-binding oxidoreductase [Desulfobacterales bacterium]|nr:FAD-binding oxidoreductase [Desulfobacterales bacterium]
MSIKEKLLEIVGAGNFFDQSEVLKKYSGDFSLTPSGAPSYVVKPKDALGVQKVIKFANEQLIPVVPVSSGVHFYGATIPKQGGIILDLAQMNQVLEIDEYNRRVRIEAGVTWDQLTEELKKKGMRMIMPLLPHAGRSVLTDYLEREVPTNTVYDYGEPLQSMEVVWPTGEIFRTGSASVNGYPDSISKGANPSGPGLDFYRFLQGAQGTMGVVTWTNLKIESIPKIDKIFFAPVEDLAYAQEFLYRILPRRIGQECLLLNNVNLAILVAENWPGDFDKMRSIFPPWTLILVISGLLRRPEEKITYEENLLNQIIKNEFRKLSLTETLAGIPGIGRKLLSMLRKPWPVGKTYWKNLWKGGSQSLFFITRPMKTPEYVDVVKEVAARHGYPMNDIGTYIQPIEHNRACQVEFTFFYDPANGTEKAMITDLYHSAAVALMNKGALFTRPYGELAPMVYDRAAGYTMALKRVKKVFDPKNIMNPGNLCF